jgi:hypothetical protein
MVLDDPLVATARELAKEAHAGHFRKAGGVPYFAHLDAVARTLVEHGYRDPIMIAAAYLHDLIEDRPEHAARMTSAMGPEVEAVVRALTEIKYDEAGQKRDKRARFASYVEGLKKSDDAVLRAIPISCADKIDNVRSLIEAERAGHRLLGRLSTRPGEHAPQLASLREIYARVVPESLLAIFDAEARTLAETIDAWLPGRAVQIAADAHLGQYDKVGAPYVYHPLRAMMRATDRDQKMAAVLHDVVEDSVWTIEDLTREGFSKAVVRAVEHLTKREGEAYEAFIERVAQDRLATRVKLLDLEDNSDPSRLGEPTAEDRARLEKYRCATDRLRRELDKRSLYVVLDEESRGRLRALAIHPEIKADHVTLAHRVDPSRFDPAWIPGNLRLGEHIEIRGVGQVRDHRVQALLVEIEGARTRPFDGGALHITMSLNGDARARESNTLIAVATPVPSAMPLRGTIAWVDDW